MSAPRCRLCGATLTVTFVDLGMSPPCESYVEGCDLDRGEMFYPLHVRICGSCLLVQLPAYLAGEEIFSHYAYFSSYSDSWVAHAERYVHLAAGQLDQGETFYPLHVRICSECLLVQLPAYISGEEIFSHYAYFSSYSDSWVAHAKTYVDDAAQR
ncbi:MAG TPA: hypothetical protein VFL10_12355, partial [Ornithinibacter sp.]|nr:hypothetical protein [Ornithinibacter sp.]